MRDAIWAELLKVRRSQLPWVTALAFLIAAGVGGLFMFILQDPDRARQLGLLGSKAQLVEGAADWPSYLALLAQTAAVGGLLVYGVIAIWIFGREFSDATATDLLALPTRREAIVAAKFIVVLAWCGVLALLLFVAGLAVGALLRLPGWSAGVVVRGWGTIVATAVLTALLVAAFGLAASIWRGYLAAVGVLFATVFVAQIVAALGYGHVFPWSVPAVYSGIAGSGQPPVSGLGISLVVVVGLACVTATILWWRQADQTR
jgi:ABC-2 type transport system permease protein